MRRHLSIVCATAVALIAPVVQAPVASAHGWVTAPPSRQEMCARGRIACGPVKYEPQSVEGPKGLRSCSAGRSTWAELDDDSRPWPVTTVGTTVPFTWVFTAAHRTTSWEYFIDGTRIAAVSGGGALPSAQVTHTVDLSRYPGRRTVLAVWTIDDTANAFYACIDLQVGSGSAGAGAGTTAPAATSRPAPATTPRPPATTTTARATPSTTPTPRPGATTGKRPAGATTPPLALPPSGAAAPTRAGGSPGAPSPSPVTSAGVAPPGSASASGHGSHPEDAGSSWRPGTRYRVGDQITYGGFRYVALMRHPAFPGWEPPFVRCLWRRI